MVAVALAAAAQWVPVGVSGSQLHVFVDRGSVVARGDLREAVVRIGSPRTITGRIAIVYELEQFDCQRRQWRLISYRGVDADRRVVANKPPAAVPPPMLDVQPDSLGERVLETVCAFKLPGKS